ncbi:hypothetical protein ES708_18070 [subsurface metagenome]
MELKNVYDTEKHFVIDFKKSELKIILEDVVKCIRVENREMSMEEHNVIRDIKEILGLSQLE